MANDVFHPDLSHRQILTDKESGRKKRLKRSFRSIPTIWIGKILRSVLRLVKKGGGSALPGRVVELLDSGFLGRMLQKMPRGVVVVSGTNGKTTTAHIVAQMLEEQGLRVFTNRSGSNFVRGVISSLLGHCSIFGSPKADVAVLELDEAHAVHFVELVRPDVSLILNVMRDQLDRFGEIDKTAKLLGKIVSKTTQTVILNREDERVANLKKKAKDGVQIVNFGYSQPLKKLFVTDDELHASKLQQKLSQNLDDENDNEEKNVDLVNLGDWKLSEGDWEQIRKTMGTNYGNLYGSSNEVILLDLATKNHTHFVKYSFNNHIYETELSIPGAHNALNLTSAIAAVRAVMKNDIDATKLFKSANSVSSAFGRGEKIEYENVDVELVLVKNPAGFRIALISFEPDDCEVLIAINDDFADSRDVSWLWDVNFDLLKPAKNKKATRSISTTGMRSFDIALRLEYAQIEVNSKSQNVKNSVDILVNAAKKKCADEGKPHCRIYATYTAMLEIRKILTKKSLEG